jgi:alkylhydroperoxidase/carboxymuconolactone decarboxylase family protein YurZ
MLASSVLIYIFRELLHKGANKREIAEAIAVAVIVAGGSQLHWTSI